MKLLIQFHYSLFFQGSHIDNGQGFLTSHQVFDLWIYNTHIATVPTQFITEIPRKPVQLTAPNTILRVTFITPETSEPNLIIRFPSSDTALVRNSPDPFTPYSAKRASCTDREETNFPPEKDRTWESHSSGLLHILFQRSGSRIYSNNAENRPISRSLIEPSW